MAEANEQTPPATPKEGEGNQPASTPEMVSVPKEDWEGVMKSVDEIRQSVEKQGKQIGFFGRKVSGKKPIVGEEGEPAGDEGEQMKIAAQVAQKISLSIASNPDYQKVIAQDKTLQKVIESNPLNLLGEQQFQSIEEAVESFRDYMDERVLDLTPAKPDEKPSETPSAPAPTNANPAEGAAKTEEEKRNEELAKLPPLKRIERQIAGRVKIK